MIKAYGKHVFVQRERITQKGSILLAKEEVADRGVVTSVGHKVEGDIKEGDTILFKKWQERNTSDGRLVIINEADIWLVIDRPEDADAHRLVSGK